MATLTNPLLKTLTMSTKLTLSPHFTPSFSLKSHNLTLPVNPIKTPFSLSLFTTFAAQKTTHWDPQLEKDTTFGAHHNDGDYGGGDDDVESESQKFDLRESESVKLFVGNLSYDVDHDELAQVFETAGQVEFAQVIYNRDTGTSRGFGFVTMSTIEEVEKAEQMFNGYELKGRSLVVNKAAPKGSRQERPPREYKPSFRLFAGNLPWNVDDVRLEQVFSKYGEVLRARVLSDKETGRSRGFGFVTMASETGMNDAIAALDGQTLDGRTIRVDVAADRPRF